MTRSVMLGDRRESPWDETKHPVFAVIRVLFAMFDFIRVPLFVITVQNTS